MGVLEEMGKKHGQSLQVIQWNEAMLSNCISNSVYINHYTVRFDLLELGSEVKKLNHRQVATRFERPLGRLKERGLATQSDPVEWRWEQNTSLSTSEGMNLLCI